ncbi:MAG TPA: multidrug efflux RND transporter permease subunit [Candidatus Saccharimonadales bacterium]|jgi:multidrug efflux pump|nr:multidrug efflux RND transporter permease subunit [Candidatus Saccharimonadales bacterium]
MNISAPFIRRPIATSLLTVALLLAGALAYSRLPVAPLPQVEYPVVQVSANLPGASPETMASAVATPLERQFGRIAGVNQMTSTSQLGSTNITLQFDLNRNIDAAARDVQAAINGALGQLPANLPTRPNFRKVNPADAPIMIMALTSNTVSKPRMYDIADSVLAQKLSQVPGVGQVFVGGGARPAVRAEVNPALLSKLGVGMEQVRLALGAANANRPKGEVSGADSSWQISANDQLFEADKYGQIIVATGKSGVVHLSDVSEVKDDVEDTRNAGLANGAPAVLMIVFRQPGANIIDAVDHVRALLPQLQASIPPTIKLDIILDRTNTIRASVRDIQISLMVSIVLVILVVFIFLRNARATFIPSVVVPLSLVGTFSVMYLAGYSIDNLSLMALAISTGFVVDDAIVVIEDITRYMEQGMGPVAAAFRGAKEIGFTVLSMSISLVAVFIPILLMGGIIGRLFREFAVVLSTAIGMSLVISLTATPMMCAKILRLAKPEEHGPLFRASDRVFNFILGGYRGGLKWVLRHQPLTLGVTAATACLSIYLYIIVPKGFFPQQDTGRVSGGIQAAQDIAFPALRDKMTQFVGIVKSDPAVENVAGFAGGNGNANGGRMFLTLKPNNQRKVTADQVINRLRGKLSVVPGATLFLQATQDLQIGGRQSNSQFQYTLQTENLEDLRTWAPRILEKLRHLPEMRDMNSDQQDRGLEAQVIVDRDTASRLGVSSAQVDNALYDSFGQRQVSNIYRQLNQYHVVMEVAPEFQTGTDSLKNVYVQSSNGVEVPLSTFTHSAPSNTALQVNHQGQFPSVTLSFNLAPGLSLGQATVALEKALRQIGVPSTVKGGFQGAAAAFQSSLSSQPLLILAALLTVYIVLGILYESLIHPITILSTLPSAGVGALLALLISGTELNVIALIGILLLIGIVKKNAIMMVDFALMAEREEKKSPEEAIFQACMLRFRPIMMTTMAAMLGGLPLAIGFGTGSELRRPLGIAIVGGLLVSQVLTLFTTPVVYLYLDRLRSRKPA